MSQPDNAFPQLIVTTDTNYGLVVAGLIITVWAASLIYLLKMPLEHLPIYAIAPLVIWQMFLYTGLFVTAHDAMHGVVFPKNRQINNWVGTFAALVYALFSFRQLSEKHCEHHQNPASDRDPDFHNGKHKNFLAWYWQFTKTYWSWGRIIGLGCFFNVAKIWWHVPEDNLLLFWMLPSVLSSVQLFFFGSFLPHSEPKTGYSDRHRAHTQGWPVFLSLITCYHFGYHHEHHAHPHLAWWQLPVAYKHSVATSRLNIVVSD